MDDAPGSGAGPERAAAEFVTAVSLSSVPDRVLNRSRLLIADTLGAIVGGVGMAPIRHLADRWGEDGSTAASIPGRAARTAPFRAAVVGGAAGAALEIDSGHRAAGGHPATYLLPALLADGEARGRSGEALLGGFVAGYEVCARAGIATSLDPRYHPHGVTGAVGAAAALSHSRGYEVGETLAATRVAAGGAQHGRFAAALEGVPNAYAGIGNARALLAADQAAVGFGGLDRGIERHLELATDDGAVDAAAFAAGLGDRWEIEESYFKIHAACRFTHSALDAVARLQSRHAPDPAAVTSVDVRTYPIAARLDEPHPRNPYESKFSIPFAVATRLLRGSSDKAAFGQEALTPETLALAERVTVETTDEMADRLPDHRSARVTVRLTDGTEHVEEVRDPRGGAAKPVGADALREKFDSLVAPSLGADGADNLWNAVQDLPATDASALAARTRP